MIRKSTMLDLLSNFDKISKIYEPVFKATVEHYNLPNPYINKTPHYIDFLRLYKYLDYDLRNDAIPDKIGEVIDRLGVEIFPWSAIWYCYSKAWLIYRQEYHFDPEFGKLVLSTKFPKTLPVDLLKNPPFNCFYVENPNKKARSRGYLFFYYPKEDTNEEPALLTILGVGIEGRSNESYLTNGVHFKEDTLEECLMFQKDEVENQENCLDMSEIKEALLLYLYLSAQNAQVSERIKVEKRVKDKGLRYRREEGFISIVGEQYGRLLRRYYQYEGEDLKTGFKMSPHVRGAHFHHFWIGSKQDESLRSLKLRWVEPTFVNLHLGEIKTRVNTVDSRS